jgi:uncharacterized protein YraI
MRSKPARIAILIPLVALMCALFSITPTLADFRVVRVSGDDTLNMRASPKPNSAIVRRLSFNARGVVDLGKSKGSWRYVAYRGSRGWVYGYYIQGDDPAERTHYSIAGTDNGRVAEIHSWPSALSRRVGEIPNTETGVGSAGPCTLRWCKVSYAGVRGWVRRKNLAVWIP